MKIQLQPNQVNDITDLASLAGGVSAYIQYLNSSDETTDIFFATSTTPITSTNSSGADFFISCDQDNMQSTKSIKIGVSERLYGWYKSNSTTPVSLIVTDKQVVDVGYSDNMPSGAFEGYRAITTQSYTEANVKNGVQFSASSYFTGLTSGENLDVIIVTGAKPILIKAQYVATENSDDIITDFYRAPTYTGGANISAGIYNQTDISPQATTVQLIGVAPTNPAAYNFTPDDTTKPNVTNVGTKIQPTLVVLGNSGIGGSTQSRSVIVGLETVLQPNSTYLYRRHATGATAALFGFSTWYEGEPDLPLPTP